MPRMRIDWLIVFSNKLTKLTPALLRARFALAAPVQVPTTQSTMQAQRIAARRAAAVESHNSSLFPSYVHGAH